MESDVKRMCRTCLQQIFDQSSVFYMNTLAWTKGEPVEDPNLEEATIEHLLSTCVPELDMALMPDASICQPCVAALISSWKFRKTCIQSEMEIQKHLAQDDSPVVSLDLSQLVALNQNGNDIKLEDLTPEEIKIEAEDEFVCTTVDDIMNEHSYAQAPDGFDIKKQHDFVYFKCYLCSYTTNSQSAIVKHTTHHATKNQKHHATKNQHQQMPKTSIKQIENNEIEKDSIMTDQADDKRFKCSYCNFKCKQKTGLSRHLLIHTGDKPYKCEQCDYRSNWTCSLNRHKKIHAAEKPFACNHCSFKSCRKSDLTSHLILHSGMKPFGCPQCEFRTYRKQNLRRHIMRHTGEKPLACPHCSYRAINPTSIKFHLHAHHPSGDNTATQQFKCKRLFRCAQCSFTSQWRNSLEQHSKIHIGKKRFKCTKCSFKVVNLKVYKNHMAAHSTDIPILVPVL